MTLIQAIILGLIQGFSEFLPISSSGHLILFQNIFGLKNNMMTFDILLHMGTLFAIFIFYWHEIFALIRNPFQKTTFLLIIGTLPAVIFTLVLGDKMEELFRGGVFLAISFIITACLLLITDSFKNGYKKDKNITYKDAIIIGSMQAIAIIPGISRSGSTITGSVIRNLDRNTAAKFSFLLSMPAILGAVFLQIKNLIFGNIKVENLDFIPIIVGFFVALISGYFSIKFMLKLITKARLKYFSYYLFFLSFLILIDHFFINKFF